MLCAPYDHYALRRPRRFTVSARHAQLDELIGSLQNVDHLRSGAVSERSAGAALVGWRRVGAQSVTRFPGRLRAMTLCGSWRGRQAPVEALVAAMWWRNSFWGVGAGQCGADTRHAEMATRQGIVSSALDGDKPRYGRCCGAGVGEAPG